MGRKLQSLLIVCLLISSGLGACTSGSTDTK